MRTIVLLLIGLILSCGIAEAQGIAQVQDTLHAKRNDSLGGAIIGIAGGFEGGMLWGHIPVAGGGFDCAGEFTSGRSSSPWVGIDLLLPRIFFDRFDALVRGSWSRSNGQFTARPVAPYSFFDSRLQRSVQVDDEYRLRSSFDMLRLDLLLSYTIDKRWSIGTGPSIGWRYASTFSESDAIVAGELRFEKGEREMPVAEGIVLTPRSLAVGGVIVGRYMHRFGPSLLLMPEISVRAELTSPANEFHWSRIVLGAGISLAYDFTSSPGQRTEFPLARETMMEPEVASFGIAPPVLAPEVLAPEVPAPPVRKQSQPPHASLDLHGIDAKGNRLPVATVSMYDALYRRSTPLLPVIYFDKGSALIPSRYSSIVPGQTESFSIDSLAGDLPEINRHLLDIIGSRLRADGGESVTLVGSSSPEEPPALARARAEAVGLYLSHSWKIDESQITIAVSEARRSLRGSDERFDRRSVSITSSTPELLAPVVTHRRVRLFDPPLIALEPTWQTDAGLKEWKIALRYERQLIGWFSSHDTGDGARLNWQIASAGATSARSPIVAELTVIDSLGDSTQTESQIPLEIEQARRIVDESPEGNREQGKIIFSLFPFEKDSDALTGRNREVIDEIAASIHAGSRVVVIGYADNAETGRHAVELSAHRAERTASAIRAALKEEGLLKNVTITMGDTSMEIARYENDLSEEHLPFRHIDVIVEQSLSGAGTGLRRR